MFQKISTTVLAVIVLFSAMVESSYAQSPEKSHMVRLSDLSLYGWTYESPRMPNLNCSSEVYQWSDETFMKNDLTGEFITHVVFEFDKITAPMYAFDNCSDYFSNTLTFLGYTDKTTGRLSGIRYEMFQFGQYDISDDSYTYGLIFWYGSQVHIVGANLSEHNFEKIVDSELALSLAYSAMTVNRLRKIDLLK